MTNDLKKHRTCNGCRALEFDRPGMYCSLWYPIDSQKGIPKTPCPKPKTVTLLVSAPKHRG